MKTKLILAVLFFSVTAAMAQFNIGDKPKDEPKEQYNFIVIYRNWEQVSVSRGDYLTRGSGWVTKTEGFATWEELMKWLNTGNVYYSEAPQKKSVRLGKDELIAIYDLRKTRSIKLRLDIEDKITPKHVEVQEEKWTDEQWMEEKK